MFAKSNARSPRIEVLEPLVLMSASGMDAELCESEEVTAGDTSPTVSSDDFGGETAASGAVGFDGVGPVSIGNLENDQLVLSGERSDYRITDLQNGAIRISDGQSAAIVNDVATLVFNGQAIAIEALDFDAVMAAPVTFVTGSDPFQLPTGPIPVEADGGIGDGAGPIPLDSTGSVNISAEDLEFPVDPDDLPGSVPGSTPDSPSGISGPPTAEDGSLPISISSPIPVNNPNASVGITATGEPLFFDSSGDPIALPSFAGGNGADETGDVEVEMPVFADSVMSANGTGDVNGLDPALLQDSLTTAGPEAQSGAVQDTSATSESLVVTADSSAGFPIEQPPTITPTIQGTDAGEWIAGGVDDSIAAGGGDDEIYVPAGANIIDGGDGEDTLVIYEGYRDQYTIALRSDGVSTLEGPGLNGETMRVDLYNVERIQFNDGTLDLSTITTVVANPPADNPTLAGTDAGEWIGGTTADDIINAGGGDDEIYAPLGTNEIDGGEGEDTLLVYQGNQADYTLSNIGDGRIYIEGPGLNGETVRSLLSNVERILFNDGVVLTSDITDLSDTMTLNDPLANSETAVAGASIVAGDSAGNINASSGQSAVGDGLVSAFQAIELVQESGFEDVVLTQESATAFAGDVLNTFEAAGLATDAISDEGIASGVAVGFDAVELAGVDLDSLTIEELVQAGADALDVFQTTESDETTIEEFEAAADAGLASLEQSRFDVGTVSAGDVFATASDAFDELLADMSSTETETFNASLLGFGIDLDALLSGFDDPGANI